MSDYDNTNKGAIWKNDRKETDRHPDFKGNLNVEGVEYWVSGWKRGPDASINSPALKFSIQPKEQQQKPVQKPATSHANGNDFVEDTDIPF